MPKNNEKKRTLESTIESIMLTVSVGINMGVGTVHITKDVYRDMLAMTPQLQEYFGSAVAKTIEYGTLGAVFCSLALCSVLAMNATYHYILDKGLMAKIADEVNAE